MPLIASTSLPDVRTIHDIPADQQCTILDLLFEPSPDLHTLWLDTLCNQHFASYDDLIQAIRARLHDLDHAASGSDHTKLLAILGSHPRLGAPKVDSAQSAAEQAHLQGDATALAALNEEYEAKFPGLRYVVFVKGIGGRDAVLGDMRARIQRADDALERRDAIDAMCDIAQDRASKLT